MPHSSRKAARSSLPRPPHVRRRRFVHAWWNHQWPILAALWMLFMGLGYIGFFKYFELYPVEMPHGPGDLLYYTLQLLPMESGARLHPVPWELQVARYSLPILGVYTTVAALIVAFWGRTLRLRLRMTRGHVVICGLGDKGLRLARGFHSLGARTVVVERDRANPWIEQCRDEGIAVLVGDATDADVLKAAGVARAEHLISVCRDDGANAEVALAAGGLVARRRGLPLACIVHILDPDLCQLLRQRELTSGSDPGMRLELFSVVDLAARTMLAEYPLIDREQADRRLHVLVVGLGNFGRSVVLQAARDWQSHYRESAQRLRMTLIGKDAKRVAEALCTRYPRLASTCEIVPHTADVTRPDFDARAVLVDADGCCDLSAAYICLNDEPAAISIGLSLRECLPVGAPRIIVRVRDEVGLAKLLPRGAGPACGLLRTFPVYERACTPELVLGGAHETLARAIHSQYVRQQTARGDTPQSNPSLVPWDDLPPRLQEANRRQADDIGVKLETLGCALAPLTDWDADRFTFTPGEVEMLAVKEHERWMDDYVRAGWVHAPGDKQNRKKTHPSLVPWSQLTEDEKEKDRDTIRSLPVFLARAGFQIERRRPAQPAGVTSR
jgi:hypothetical protein